MSSDDESSGSNDDSRNKIRSRPPPPFISKSASKSRKKNKLPPQETIDEIWSRFSASKFSKATRILPLATKTEPPTANPTPNNLLVSEDFERAVQECRSKVRKLIKECKRVNLRFRDTWDIGT
jgi:hypothetical protein